MTPEQRAFMDEHHPDHHLKFNNTKNIWLVEAYGTTHQFKSTDYKGPDKAKAEAVAFRDSLPSNAFDWDYRLVEQVKSDVVGVNRFSLKGSPQWSAQCYITDEFGRRRLHTKRFSVRKYGEREAYELAVAARKAMLAEAEQQELKALKQGKVRATKGSNRHMAGSK